jgi:serine protease Do
MPDEKQTADASDAAAPSGGTIGVALAPLSPDVREQLSLPEGAKGAVIAGVQPGSRAAKAGLKEGDLLVGVGTTSVSNPNEAVKAIRAAKGKAVALRVMRDGQARFMAVPPANAEG